MMFDRINVQVFVFTRNPKFKILILKRILERSGYWQPRSGGIEAGEKPLETIKREVYEETGLKKLERIINLEYNFIFKTTWGGKLAKMKEYCYAAEIKEENAIQLSSEHEEYKWCTENEAKIFLKWKHNRIALNKLINLLKLESRGGD